MARNFRILVQYVGVDGSFRTLSSNASSRLELGYMEEMIWHGELMDTNQILGVRTE